MHDIEPHYKWRDSYIASDDEQSPFYGRVYSEFKFTKKVYNYFIHPQWDEFGSATLYMKILFVDYEEKFAIFELIGEWNDCLTNDVMYLKRNIIDELTETGINKFILVCENVLNFHGSDDCYYEEWYDDIKDEQGWICFLNVLDHVEEEMCNTSIQHYVNLGLEFKNINWRRQKPKLLFQSISQMLASSTKKLSF